MALNTHLTRQLACCWRPLAQSAKTQEIPQGQFHRKLHSARLPRQRPVFPANLPPQFLSQIPRAFRGEKKPPLKIYPKPACPSDTCKSPIQAFTDTQLRVLDPTGERKALFDKRNREGVKVGDILRVTLKNGDPFNGVCLNIRTRGIDTAFLLRNELTKVACEMWVKLFSPNVQRVEIVQRTPQRKRRARLTYMRHPKHDLGSVEGVVRQYFREKSILNSTGGKQGGGQQRKGKRS